MSPSGSSGRAMRAVMGLPTGSRWASKPWATAMTISSPCCPTLSASAARAWQDGIAVPHDHLHDGAGDAQFHQHGAGGVLAGVGDELADHQLGQVHRARGHRDAVHGLDSGEEFHRAVTRLSYNVPVAVQGDGVLYRRCVRHHAALTLGD